jgi:hypothetical protein
VLCGAALADVTHAIARLLEASAVTAQSTVTEMRPEGRGARCQVGLTFVDSAASGFTLAAGLRGRAVAATERASEGARRNRPDAEQVLFGQGGSAAGPNNSRLPAAVKS